MVQFKNIPSNLRVPGFFAEVDNSQANSSTAQQRTLIIAQKLASGAATSNVPVLSLGASDAKTQGGVGSQLALMVDAYRQNDSFGEVWTVALDDAQAAAAAVGNFLFTQQATANGTLCLYIAGTLVSLPVTAGESMSDMATALAAAINATDDLPVSAAVDNVTAAQVDITALNKGAVGNDIDLRVNYEGTAGGEVTPTGLTFTITAMTGGATNPTLTAALAALQDLPFDVIIHPYSDATSMNALDAFLNDQTGRWSWLRKIYGQHYTFYRGTAGARQTYGFTRNGQHGTVCGIYDTPTAGFVWVAAMIGAAAVSLRADPGLPLHSLAVSGVLPPPPQSRDNISIRQTLLYSGISTYTVDQDGTVRIEMLITTYQKNAFGQDDNSYLKVETMYLLMYVLRDLENVVTSRYSRCKLAANGTRFAPGANVVTPNIIKADLVSRYRVLERQGYVQNSDAFMQAIIVEKDTNNPNRVNVMWPGTLINQLDILALLAQFRLQ